jgi:quercetin dioxygenase-like cupin family protein
MLHLNMADLPFEDLKKEGARNVRVKYLIDERSGANRFYLRYYELAPGGQTPLDQHVHEHEVYVLSGEGRLLLGHGQESEARPLKPGDAVYIASKETHRFENNGERPFTFLCVKGDPRLYETELEEIGEEVGVC